jgi:hypothetical protein
MRRKQYEDELKKAALGRIQLKSANILEVAKAWQKKKADAGWAVPHWPKDYGGRGASPIERVIWQQEEGVFGKLGALFIIGHGMCGPTMMAYAAEEHKRQLSAAAGLRREDLVPVVLRTRRRLRRRGSAHPRGKGRRRLGHQRPEDLDFRRALLGLRHPDHPHRSHCAEAQGPHHVLPGHEEPGRRGEADQAGQRPGRVQRGVFHRRPDSRRAAARRRRRWLERVADHADERAHGDRRQCRHRLPGAVRVLQQSDAR